MIKNFEDFINEEHEIREQIDGLKLVKKISTEDFMESIKNNTIDNKYLYRLIEYVPKPDKWVKDVSEPHEVFKPVYVLHSYYHKGHSGKIYTKEMYPMIDADIDWKGKTYSTSMFKSPFIAFPSNYREITDYYLKKGPYYMRYGKIKQDISKMVKGSHIGFKGLSISAVINAYNEGDIWELGEEGVLDLNRLLGENDYEGIGKCGRNYIGYDFAEVFAYEVVDSNAAIEAISEENKNTDTKGTFLKTYELD